MSSQQGKPECLECSLFDDKNVYADHQCVRCKVRTCEKHVHLKAFECARCGDTFCQDDDDLYYDSTGRQICLRCALDDFSKSGGISGPKKGPGEADVASHNEADVAAAQ